MATIPKARENVSAARVVRGYRHLAMGGPIKLLLNF
jgi:hypothetical protein